MLSDRNRNVSVFIRHGRAPLNPRQALFVVYVSRRRPLRFIEIEILIQRTVGRQELRRIGLIGCSAVGGRYADYYGARVSVEPEPYIVVSSARIKSVIQCVYDGRRTSVGVKTDFGDVPALRFIFQKRLYDRFRNRIVHYGVGIIEKDIIQPRHGEQFDVSVDNPRIVHRIITVKRFAVEVELPCGRIGRVGRIVERVGVFALKFCNVVRSSRRPLIAEPREIEHTEVFLFA